MTALPPAVTLVAFPLSTEETEVQGLDVGFETVGVRQFSTALPTIPSRSSTGCPLTLSLAVLEVATVPSCPQVMLLPVVRTFGIHTSAHIHETGYCHRHIRGVYLDVAVGLQFKVFSGLNLHAVLVESDLVVVSILDLDAGLIHGDDVLLAAVAVLNDKDLFAVLVFNLDAAAFQRLDDLARRRRLSIGWLWRLSLS